MELWVEITKHGRFVARHGPFSDDYGAEMEAAKLRRHYPRSEGYIVAIMRENPSTGRSYRKPPRRKTVDAYIGDLEGLAHDITLIFRWNYRDWTNYTISINTDAEGDITYPQGAPVLAVTGLGGWFDKPTKKAAKALERSAKSFGTEMRQVGDGLVFFIHPKAKRGEGEIVTRDFSRFPGAREKVQRTAVWNPRRSR